MIRTRVSRGLDFSLPARRRCLLGVWFLMRANEARPAPLENSTGGGEENPNRREETQGGAAEEGAVVLRPRVIQIDFAEATRIRAPKT